MILLLVVISLLVGTALAEVAVRTFGGQWFRRQLAEIGMHLEAFRLAKGDAARQLMLLRSGRATLQFSLVVLGLVVGMMAIAGLAPWTLKWSASQQTTYLIVSSVAATVWWIFRRSCRPTTHAASSPTVSPSDRAR